MIKSRKEVQADLQKIFDYFDNISDVVDGPEGIPKPNTEMKLLMLVETTMEYVDYHDANS